MTNSNRELVRDSHHRLAMVSVATLSSSLEEVALFARNALDALPA
jgi:hypothetical protein